MATETLKSGLATQAGLNYDLWFQCNLQRISSEAAERVQVSFLVDDPKIHNVIRPDGRITDQGRKLFRNIAIEGVDDLDLFRNL